MESQAHSQVDRFGVEAGLCASPCSHLTPQHLSLRSSWACDSDTTEFLQSVCNGFTTQIPLQLSCDCSTSMKGSPWNTLEQTRVSLEQQPDIKCGKNRDDRLSEFPRHATGCMGLPERQHCVAVFWLILREPCPLCMLSYGLWWWC